VQIPKPAPAAVKRFEELTPKGPNVTSKKVFGQPAAFVNGNMFFGVFGASVFVRLSETDRSDAEGIPGFKAFEPMPGRPMKGYFVVPRSVLASRTQFPQWVERSMRFASSLPPKKAKPKTK
jgi:TfoX/Sxy family transcriptional regulator of competence genes